MVHNIIFDKNKISSPSDTLIIGFFLGILSTKKYSISNKFLTDVLLIILKYLDQKGNKNYKI